MASRGSEVREPRWWRELPVAGSAALWIGLRFLGGAMTATVNHTFVPQHPHPLLYGNKGPPTRVGWTPPIRV